MPFIQTEQYYNTIQSANMKHYTFFTVLLTLIFFTSCSSLRSLDELSESAETAYEAGNQEEAFEAYNRLIAAYRNQNREPDGEIYQRAGLIAFELNETAKAIEYLELARHSHAVDDKTYLTLAKAYREIDNLSREITMLEQYVEGYSHGPDFKDMQRRYFLTLAESLNYQQAYALWPQLAGEAGSDETLLTAYLQTLQALGHERQATLKAEEILSLNRNNIKALDWLAKRHFRQADDLYRREMQAYEQNRTRRQYAQLLESLEVINTDLRIALDYFKRLYAQDPRSEYASYMANIYERFQDDENARYYRRRAQ